MVVLKLSRWKEKREDKLWIVNLVEKIKQDGGIQIIEDVPYDLDWNKGQMKQWLSGQGVKDVRFRTPPPREEPEQIRGNHKTFREFFLGKYPECDVRILGIAGEQSWMAIARMAQCMADYSDYIAERLMNR